MESKWVDSGLLELYSSCHFLPHLSRKETHGRMLDFGVSLRFTLEILLLCLKTGSSSVPRLASNVLLLLSLPGAEMAPRFPLEFFGNFWWSLPIDRLH